MVHQPWPEASNYSIPRAPARRLPSALISMTIGFLAKLASELHLRCMAPAPLLVFRCVHHVDMLQLDSAPVEVEFRAAAHGQS